jgi:hypothetical protein
LKRAEVVRVGCCPFDGARDHARAPGLPEACDERGDRELAALGLRLVLARGERGALALPPPIENCAK